MCLGIGPVMKLIKKTEASRLFSLDFLPAIPVSINSEIADDLKFRAVVLNKLSLISGEF